MSVSVLCVRERKCVRVFAFVYIVERGEEKGELRDGEQ